VLDLGSRHQPYRPLLKNRGGQYVALDIRHSPGATVIADGQVLPFAPDSFDLVIATQVFEYFENPRAAAQQIFDVLRPGGTLMASVASFSPLFISLEQWRFLPRGIRSIFAPFKKLEVVPEVHDLGSFVRNVNVGLSVIFRPPGIRLLYRWLLCPMLNLVGLALEKLNLPSTDSLVCNFSIRAQKGDPA
jgi:SAM-dependent methyltransferase